MKIPEVPEVPEGGNGRGWRENVGEYGKGGNGRGWAVIRVKAGFHSERVGSDLISA